MKKILFTGGGSAGHVQPNIAIMEDLIKNGEAELCYMGSDGIEKKLVAPLKIPYFIIDPPKLKRSVCFSNLKIPFAFKKAVQKASEGLRAFQPSLVFSKGGFVSLPVVVAAHKMGIPCLTHESDLSAGLANKLMARRCEKILTSFPETADKFKNGKFVGSPLRSSLFGRDRAAARKKYGFLEFSERKTLLVFGGGSGSRKLNEALFQALPVLSKSYDILHLCGAGNGMFCKYKGYVQKEFETDMGSAYAACDLVVSRAGSNTAFEILALKKPALFVPLGKESRGDQAENAAYFEKKGLARVLPENKLSCLAEEIAKTLADERMQERIALSDFSGGNGRILREIRRYL